MHRALMACLGSNGPGPDGPPSLYFGWSYPKTIKAYTQSQTQSYINKPGAAPIRGVSYCKGNALLYIALLCVVSLCFAMRCTALRCLEGVSCNRIPLHVTLSQPSHCVALLCFVLLCFALLRSALPFVALLCIVLRCFSLPLCIRLLCFHCPALHSFALLLTWMVLRCFALVCFALHCFISR